MREEKLAGYFWKSRKISHSSEARASSTTDVFGLPACFNYRHLVLSVLKIKYDQLIYQLLLSEQTRILLFTISAKSKPTEKLNKSFSLNFFKALKPLKRKDFLSCEKKKKEKENILKERK